MPNLKIALPNKGRLYQETLTFLEKCSLRVLRDNERQYQSRMRGLFEDIDVIFQRALDIPKVVEEGQADIGITGLDIFCEIGQENKCVLVFPDAIEKEARQIPGLPFGFCSLVLAVPDLWIDISSISDLAELAITRKKENRMLRVATEFPNLTKNYLFQKDVSYFEIIEVSGAVESAPGMGLSDIVSGLVSSGITLIENRLKVINDGKIIQSQASLIASLSLQKERLFSSKMTLLKYLVDRIEAYLNAEKYYLLIGNINKKADLEKALEEKNINIIKLTDTSISMQVKASELEGIISIFQNKGGKDIMVLPLNFVYNNPGKAFISLIEKFKR